MKKVRYKRSKGEDLVVHICNRVGRSYENRDKEGEERYPFQAEEKLVLRGIIRHWTNFYYLEIISLVVMGNHYHLMLRVRPKPELTLQDIADRWNSFHGYEEDNQKFVLATDYNVEKYRSRSGSLSMFVADVQREFTKWFHEKHGTDGRFWKSRFTCVPLKGGKAVWDCAAYIALNPVRAGIAIAPEFYDFGDLGEFNKTGTFQHIKQFVNCLRDYHFYNLTKLDDELVVLQFKAHIIRSLMRKNKYDSPETIRDAVNILREENDFADTMLQRCPAWTRSEMIGEEEEVIEASEKQQDYQKKEFNEVRCFNLFYKKKVGEELKTYPRASASIDHQVCTVEEPEMLQMELKSKEPSEKLILKTTKNFLLRIIGNPHHNYPPAEIDFSNALGREEGTSTAPPD